MGDGQSAAEISGPMVPGGAVYSWVTRLKFTPDGRHVIYRANQEATGIYELYRVPIAGPQGNSDRLSGPMPANGSVETDPSYAISPNGQWVTYVADQQLDNVWELYAVGEGEFRVYLPLVTR
jgi:Tol biopolymer transport system component